MKIAVFPGSFDPITNGHIDLVRRFSPLFDKIIVAVGVNSAKKGLFTLEQRMSWLEEVFEDDDTIEVGSFTGLTVNYCKEKGAKYLIRGLRNASDFDYEKTISQLNNIIGVREIIKGKGDISTFVPEVIVEAINDSQS